MNKKQLAEFQPRLFATAYKMTGEIAASEDIAQEVITSLLGNPTRTHSLQNPLHYAIKAAVNHSLSYLKGRQRFRDAYPGVWLPEPMIQTEEENLLFSMDLSYGLLVILSKLNPKERAVYILREAYDLRHAEIAEALLISEESCKKLFQRARKTMGNRHKESRLQYEEQQKNLLALTEAIARGDFQALLSALRQDISIHSDGGGKVAAALKPLHGYETCMKFLAGLYQKNQGRLGFFTASINNQPAILLKGEEGIDTVVTFEWEAGQISAMYMIRNPEKIKLFVPKK